MSTSSAHESFSALTDIDPFAVYDRWRETAPLVWDKSAGGWLVTTYDACRHVELNEDQFRHPYADPIPDLLEIKGGETITVLQGERHTEMHRFVLSLFAPRVIQSYRDEHVRPIIADLLSQFIADGRAELTSVFTDLLPPRVILSLLNMPWQDNGLVQRVIELHDVMMGWASGVDPEKYVPLAKAASAELNAMLRPFVIERRSNPGTDLISRVWTDWPAAMGEVGEAEALAICREMFMAGSETTVHALANAFHILLTRPDIMEAVRADRTAPLAALVEESLRLFGAVQYRFRIANQDCDVGGVRVARNDKLILINSAANRDPAKYECPAHPDLSRPRSRDHLAFNTGPRVCVGAALARAEMMDAINAVLDATEDLKLDPDAPEPAFPGHFNRSFRPLHVVFTPRLAGSAPPMEEGRAR